MNDNFLTQFRQEPGAAYANRLWERLQQVVPATAVPAQSAPNRRPLRFAATCAVLICLLITGFSPAVRAQIAEVMRQIGGLPYRETAVFPRAADEEVIVVDNESFFGGESELVADARRRLDLDFNLPAPLPVRFTILEEVVYGQSGSLSATFRWQDTESDHMLVLSVKRAMPDVNRVVGPDSTTKVQVNGRDAALIAGAWSADRRAWDDPVGMRTLRWQQDDIEYSLITFGQALTEDEFVAIAESIE